MVGFFNNCNSDISHPQNVQSLSRSPWIKVEDSDTAENYMNASIYFVLEYSKYLYSDAKMNKLMCIEANSWQLYSVKNILQNFFVCNFFMIGGNAKIVANKRQLTWKMVRQGKFHTTGKEVATTVVTIKIIRNRMQND